MHTGCIKSASDREMPLSTRVFGKFRPHSLGSAAFGRTTPVIAINCFRAVHRFESANSVATRAVFFSSPRNLTFTKPNWRLDAKRVLHLRAHAGLAVLRLLDLFLGPAFRQLGDVTRPGRDVPLQIVAVHPGWSAPR